MTDGSDVDVSGRPDQWVRPTATAMAIDTVGVMPLFLTGAMAVQLEADIGLDVGSLGLVYASYFAAAAVLSAPVGRISERTGPGLSLQVGTLISILSLAGIGGLVRAPSTLTLFLVAAGLGTSLTRTASSVLVARAVKPGRQGLAFGIKNSAIPVGALTAGLSVPLVALPFGWRWSFGLAAGLGLGIMAIIPRHVPRPAPIATHPKSDLSLRVLSMAAAAFALGAAASSSLGAFTVVTAVEAGVPEGAAGVLVAFGSVVGLVSRLAMGYWSDLRAGSQLDLVSAMLIAGGIGYAAIALGDGGLMWIAVPLAFGTGWAFFGTFNLAVVRLNPKAPGAAVGVTQTGAFMGSIVGPIVLGAIADHVSFSSAWLVAAGAGVIAGFITLAIGAFLLADSDGSQGTGRSGGLRG